MAFINLFITYYIIAFQAQLSPLFPRYPIPSPALVKLF